MTRKQAKKQDFVILVTLDESTEEHAETVREELGQGLEDARDSGEIPRSLLWDISDPLPVPSMPSGEASPDPTNADRAARIARLLPLYKLATNDPEASDSTTINDMLADLCHFCEQHGLDFDFKVGEARHAFRSEQRQS